jgi:hypothetical protein
MKVPRHKIIKDVWLQNNFDGIYEKMYIIQTFCIFCNQMTQKFGLVWLKTFDIVETLHEQRAYWHKEE